MHYSYMPQSEDLKEGDVFVAKRSYPHRGYVFLTATQAGHRKTLTAVDRDGKEYVHRYGGGLVAKDGDEKLSLFWTLPLPALPEDEAVAYMETLTVGREEPILVHVVDPGKDFVRAKLVFSRHPDGYSSAPPIDGEDGVDLPTWKEFGTARVMDDELLILASSLPEGCAAGDLVACEGFSCDYEDGRLVTRLRPPSFKRPTIIGRNVAEDRLQDYVPFREMEPRHGVLGWSQVSTPKFVDFADFHDETVKAAVRLEPDEALVLWTPSSYRNGETECHFLAQSGYTFYMADSPSDWFHGAAVEPGLWVCSGAKWWSYTSYEGEHDAGIDADWTPATAEDLERFGFTPESASAEIIECLDDDGPELDGASGRTLAEEWMEKARTAAALEAAPTA